MTLRDDQINQLMKWLRDPTHKVTGRHTVQRHQQQIELIWREALRITGGDVSRALEIAVEATKSGQQPGETRPDYLARLDGIPSLAFGPPQSIYAGVDKVQHFFQVALLAQTWGPDMAKGIGRLYEVKDLIFSIAGDTGGYDKGDIHADDLGAEFGFNARISPQTSVRFFVRHPGETLGGGIGRVNAESNAQRPDAGASPDISDTNDGYDPGAEPTSTGFPVPSDFDGEDTPATGPDTPGADDDSPGPPHPEDGGVPTPGDPDGGVPTPDPPGDGSASPEEGSPGDVDSEEEFEATYVSPTGEVETYVAPADEQPGDLSGSDDDDDDDDDDDHDDDAQDTTGGYWPENSNDPGVDLVGAFKRMQATMWSAKRPATQPPSVFAVDSYVFKPLRGDIDPAEEPPNLHLPGGTPDIGRGPDYGPGGPERPQVPGPGTGPGPNPDPVAHRAGFRHVLATGLRRVAAMLDPD